MLAQKAAERPHQRHVADDVGHFTVDRRRLAGEIVMQRPAGGRQTEHDADHDAGDDSEPCGHRQADRAHQRDRRKRCRAGRQHVPDEHILAGEHRVGRRGHAARQRARQPFREIARRMAGQVPEQVAPDVAGDGDEGEIADPACQPPQQIIGGDQRAEQDEGRPHAGIGAVRQGVDQKLDAVLRADRTGDGAQDRGKDERMGQRAPPHVTKDKGIDWSSTGMPMAAARPDPPIAGWSWPPVHHRTIDDGGHHQVGIEGSQHLCGQHASTHRSAPTPGASSRCTAGRSGEPRNMLNAAAASMHSWLPRTRPPMVVRCTAGPHGRPGDRRPPTADRWTTPPEPAPRTMTRPATIDRVPE